MNALTRVDPGSYYDFISYLSKFDNTAIFKRQFFKSMDFLYERTGTGKRKAIYKQRDQIILRLDGIEYFNPSKNPNAKSPEEYWIAIKDSEVVTFHENTKWDAIYWMVIKNHKDFKTPFDILSGSFKYLDDTCNDWKTLYKINNQYYTNAY